jgi:hypothetical protein
VVAPNEVPKSIIRSQVFELPKLASKSIVIPLLKVFVAKSGRSTYGPAAFDPPGNFQAPDAASTSKLFRTVALRVAWLPRPDRSLTEVLVLNEFRSDELYEITGIGVRVAETLDEAFK